MLISLPPFSFLRPPSLLRCNIVLNRQVGSTIASDDNINVMNPMLVVGRTEFGNSWQTWGEGW